MFLKEKYDRLINSFLEIIIKIYSFISLIRCTHIFTHRRLIMKRKIYFKWTNFFALMVVILTTGGLANSAQASDLVIEPSVPMVAIGGKIQLSVSGATGKVTWWTKQGQILGTNSTRTTYVAPNKVGEYHVFVSDDNNASVGISVTVLTEKKVEKIFSPENADWKIYADPGYETNILAFSADKEILWVGTDVGLEKREANTGLLIRRFTTLDGLPGNSITILLPDENGGLWIGGIPFPKRIPSFLSLLDDIAKRELEKYSIGLVYLNNKDELTLFNQDDWGLPTNSVYALLSDGKGGIFVGTDRGLIHRDASGKWNILESDITVSNEQILPYNVKGLVDDNHGGIWIAHEGDYGLIHRSANGEWTPFDLRTLLLLDGDFIELLNHSMAITQDGKGGIWVATLGGLVHRSVTGGWKFILLDSPNSSERFNSFYGSFFNITTILSDSNDDLWLGVLFDPNAKEKGLVHYDRSNDQWNIISTEESLLPSNNVTTLLPDGTNGFWVGTKKGIAYRSKTGKWKLLENNVTSIIAASNGDLWMGTDGGYLVRHDNITNEIELFGNLELINNANFFNSFTQTLAFDGESGLWMGTNDNGIIHATKDKWEVFNRGNSELPDNSVQAFGYNCDYKKIWVGTNNGLAYLKKDEQYGQWQVFNFEDAQLPNQSVNSLLLDDSGILWIGTDEGLVSYHDDTGQWNLFETENNFLLHNTIVMDIIADEIGNMWISSYGNGLVHRNETGEWSLFNTDNTNFELPSNYITTLATDDSGGIWMGISEPHTNYHGLAHRSRDGKWDVFDQNNSGSLTNPIKALLSDGQNGLWVGRLKTGFTHLTFSKQSASCATARNITPQQCKEQHVKNKRAAIIIHPNGEGINEKLQAEHANFMATYAYNTLTKKRGYNHDEIYYVGYKPDLDFNNYDGKPEPYVDAPVTLAAFNNGDKPRDLTEADIEKAFEWAIEQSNIAKKEGLPEQPLVVYFVGHGLPDELMLSSNTPLSATKLKEWLDKYQTNTNGNTVIVILEACYSGTLIDDLKGKNRVIISSTGDNLSYNNGSGRISFTKVYFDELGSGADYWNSFNYVKNLFTNKDSRYPFNLQMPQLEDSNEGKLAPSLFLNGEFNGLPGPILTIRFSNDPLLPDPITIEGYSVISSNKVVNFLASDIHEISSDVKSIDVLIKQPHPLLSLPLKLRQANDGQWLQSYNPIFSDYGEYQVTFKMSKHNGEIIDTSPISFFVKHLPSLIDGNLLEVPAVVVPDGIGGQDIFQAKLLKRPDSDTLFELDLSSLILFHGELSTIDIVNYAPMTGGVHFPRLDMLDGSTRSANLKLLEPWLFELTY